MSAPRRLMVVDDDPKVRVLLERAFRAPEFETQAFPTGRAALARAAELRPDCVVADLLLPDTDGEKLLRALRATPGLESVPFIAVSAVRSEAREKTILDAGANGFLLKPFPLRELLDKVRAVAGLPGPAPEVSPTRPLMSAAHTASLRVVARPKAAGTGPNPRSEPAEAPATSLSRRVELAPPGSALGFGRYTRVEARSRSIVVLTEATAEPTFSVTTVITEKGRPLRKVESILPHALARAEDRETIRRQLDLQHEDALRRLEELVLNETQRRTLWNEQTRSVDANLLTWAISALAQLAEVESGPEETVQALAATHARLAAHDSALRYFEVTDLGRVALTAGTREKLPRRAVAAVAAWSVALAVEALHVSAEEAFEPIRHATQRRAVELERLGFYERLAPSRRR
jgi:CheY-like chemotaxis protein